MPKSLHRQLQSLASDEGVSLNQFIVSILARAAGAGPTRDEVASAAAQFELADRVTELEEWRPDMEGRLVDLEDEWIEENPRFREREIVRGLVEADSTQLERRMGIREDRENRIRARFDARQAKGEA